VAEIWKLKLEDRGISTFRRLFMNNSFPSNHKFTNNRSAQDEIEDEHPPIIVRCANRDKRNELFTKRKINTLPNDTKFSLKENLIKMRKSIFNEARKVKRALDFEYLWTW